MSRAQRRRAKALKRAATPALNSVPQHPPNPEYLEELSRLEEVWRQDGLRRQYPKYHEIAEGVYRVEFDANNGATVFEDVCRRTR